METKVKVMAKSKNGNEHGANCGCGGHDHAKQEHVHVHHEGCQCGIGVKAKDSTGETCCGEGHCAHNDGAAPEGDEPPQPCGGHKGMQACACEQGKGNKAKHGDSGVHSHDHGEEDGCGCGQDHNHDHGDGCGCGHDHEHSDEKIKMTDVAAIALVLVALLIKNTSMGILYAPLFIVAYGLIAFAQIKLAVKNTLRGEIFDENFLMTIATVGAIAIGEYPEAIAVIAFYRVGEYFQSRAIAKSKNSINSLLEIKSDTANLLQGEQLSVVAPETLQAGDFILIRVGERVPADGIVVKGTSSMNMAALTGEALPVLVEEGAEVLSGSVNVDGVLTVRVTRLAVESTASKIMELVENAAKSKAKTEQFITKFAKVYTPMVMILSAMVGFGSYFFMSRSMADSIYFSMIFLVISCPCALVISVPLGFFGGIGAASTKGILIKGGNYLEALGEVKEIVFDKTGTLTQGILEVSAIFPKGMSEEELLELAAVAEKNSTHPIAKAILKKSTGKYFSTDMNEYAGRGIACVFELGTVLVGNEKLMQEHGIAFTVEEARGTSIFVALNNVFAGQIMAKDVVKPEAKAVIAELHKRGIKTTMLTGDRLEAAMEIAEQIGIENVYASLLPGDKVEKLKEIIASLQKGERAVAVGDGINDAPLLILADIGISMGSLGSDAAIEASDIVLMQDKLSSIVTALDVSKSTRAVVRQNIVLSIGVKVLVMLAAPFGYGSIWLAIFADVGVSVLAILNSARLAMKK